MPQASQWCLFVLVNSFVPHYITVFGRALSSNASAFLINVPQLEVNQLQSLSCLCLALASVAFVYDWAVLARLTLVAPVMLMLWQALPLGLSQIKMYEKLMVFPVHGKIEAASGVQWEISVRSCCILFLFSFGRFGCLHTQQIHLVCIAFGEVDLWLALLHLSASPTAPSTMISPSTPDMLLCSVMESSCNAIRMDVACRARYALPTARRPWLKGCSRTGVGRDRNKPMNMKAEPVEI